MNIKTTATDLRLTFNAARRHLSAADLAIIAGGFLLVVGVMILGFAQSSAAAIEDAKQTTILSTETAISHTTTGTVEYQLEVTEAKHFDAVGDAPVGMKWISIAVEHLATAGDERDRVQPNSSHIYVSVGSHTRIPATTYEVVGFKERTISSFILVDEALTDYRVVADIQFINSALHIQARDGAVFTSVDEVVPAIEFEF